MRDYKIELLPEARRFLLSQPEKARDKIIRNIRRTLGGLSNNKLESTLFKKLVGTDIWEFRTRYNGIAYRLFAFWDTDNKTLIVATHGIIKKTQKTPSKEIKKAIEIRDNYFNK